MILIAGAGPCGLMMACELRRRGIETRVLGADPAPGTGSRAILLWPPSLEQYAELGILAEAERLGAPVRALSYHTGSRTVLRVPLTPDVAPLVLPQADTERLLERRLRSLGGSVERGVTVTGLAQDDEGVTVTTSAGASIRGEWLIAADGFRSTVRDLLGIDFTGERLPITFVLAEGKLDGRYEPEAMNYYFSRTGVVLVAPLPGARVRISGALSAGEEFTSSSAQRLLDERGPGGLRFSDITMNGTFTSHERIATRFRSGRCFLVGDAAHVHSVVGGQGLNLGFADARNLAWKLAGVLSGQFSPAILDSYEPERQAAAEQTIRDTGRMARQAVLSPAANFVRNAGLAVAHRLGVLQRTLPPMLAGWLTHYPDVLMSPGEAGRRIRGLPRSGMRDKDWPLEPGDPGRFQVITAGPPDEPLHALACALAKRAPALVTHIPQNGRDRGFVLLRPDGFVAASGQEAVFPQVSAALENLCRERGTSK